MTDHRHAGVLKPYSCLESRLSVRRCLSLAPSRGVQIENYTSHEPLLYWVPGPIRGASAV